MRKLMMAAALVLPMFGSAAMAQDTLKIGYIDPLSGGGASIGEGGLKTFQFLADELNAKGGDPRPQGRDRADGQQDQPAGKPVQAQKAIDAGIHYITQGNGSSVAAALEDFVTKNNARNPGKEMLFFNYAAVDPALTNDKCSFWHFRWDANSDIKMAALTNYMKGEKSIKKVYLINQDYSFGQAVRTEARKMLGAKRPDIEIVGDEVHPLLKVTDFSPYIAKIKASGADTVVTGNWGQDFLAAPEGGRRRGAQGQLVHLLCRRRRRADRDQADRPRSSGVPDHRRHPELRQQAGDGIREGIPRQGTTCRLFYPRAVNEMRMFKAAAEKANSLDPVKVAAALEGMKVDVFDGGEGFMRSDDHQFFQPIYISSFGSLTDKTKDPFDEENTGWGWQLVSKVDTAQTMLPTTCKMKRP